MSENTETKTEQKVDAKMAEELAKVAEALPHGSYKKIAEMCDCSDDLVRMFFKGLLPIREDNIKFLDCANKIMDKELQIEEKAMKKVQEILSKSKAA